jgi:hypothetical protein
MLGRLARGMYLVLVATMIAAYAVASVRTVPPPPPANDNRPVVYWWA